MKEVARHLWNTVILLGLWPVWWPLMVLILIASAGHLGAQDPTRKRTAILYNAFALAILSLGWKDPK